MPTPRLRTALLLCGTLTLLVGLSVVPPVSAAKVGKKQRIQALRQRLKQISEKKEEKRAELRETKRAQRRLSDQLNESYQRLEDANEALRVSEQRLRAAEADVRASTQRLKTAQDRLLAQQRRFGKRIAYYYKEGNVTYLDVLFGARDISDFLDRQYFVSRLMDQDAEIVRDLREAQIQVALERLRLVERRAALATAHQENAARVQRVADQAQERSKLLATITRERNLQERRLQELDEDSTDIQRTLEAETTRRRSTPTAFRSLPRWTGKMARPANGPVTSGFGYRYHPVLRYRRLHTGVDIGAPSGSGVYAASDGEVFFASWRGGYGRCIILLHGDDVSTLYGHLSKIYITAGQTVRRGQLIGAVGSTGLSTGPHLHFEVRRNGAPVNPF